MPHHRRRAHSVSTVAASAVPDGSPKLRDRVKRFLLGGSKGAEKEPGVVAYVGSGISSRKAASELPSHHGVATTPVKGVLHPLRQACRYGSSCYNWSSEHRSRFSHPGDNDYRVGLVEFEEDQKPELSTLWEIFSFHDVRACGHLDRGGFGRALAEVLGTAEEPPEAPAAWTACGGEQLSHVTFVRLAFWAARMNLEVPLGLDHLASITMTSEGRPCRCTSSETGKCGCQDFVQASDSRDACTCGHSSYTHRSEAVDKALPSVLLSRPRPPHWEGTGMLVQISSPEVLQQFQFLLDATHKEHDNWTRDRGCMLHGVNKCSSTCLYQHRQPVPTGYRLVAAFRNQNPVLWTRYCLMRAAIKEECKRLGCSHVTTESGGAAFSRIEGNALAEGVNEWRLFHGAPHAACVGVCETNFNLSLAGTGGSWRHSGAARGEPLYGLGIYCAERITKADEYSAAGAATPKGDAVYSVLLCRVIGGRPFVSTTDEVNTSALRRQVLEGTQHSVLGDRVRELKKPYREVVLYDRDQVYPEYLLTYSRIYGSKSH